MTENGDRERRSETNRSRPTSSMSQHSSSAGSDLEQQVSYSLEKFEEASLRGSLRRCSYRGSNCSSQFVINPLLHLSIEEKLNKIEDIEIFPNIENSESIRNIDDNLYKKIQNRPSILFKRQKDLSKTLNLSNRREEFLDQLINSQDEDEVTNPVFDLENQYVEKPGIIPLDQDSGMYSIESSNSDLVNTCHNFDENLRNNFRKAEENQLFYVHGKRYWDFGVGKYHTFGGIKSRRLNEDIVDKSDNEDPYDEKELLELIGSNNSNGFAKLKFQTFGGIKKYDQIDPRNLDTSRSIKTRKSLREITKSSKTMDRNLESEILIDFEFQRRHQNIFKRAKTVINDQDYTFQRRKSLRGKKLRTFSENEYFVDKEIMIKFLKDASARPKSRLSTDNESISSQNRARKIPGLQNYLRNNDSSKEIDSLRIEAPLIPEFIERNFETLKDLRSTNSKRSGRHRRDFQGADIF